MKKEGIIVLVLLSIVLIGIVVYFSLIKKPDIKCVQQNGYCIYSDIPSQFAEYDSPEEEIPDNFRISWQDFQEYIYFLENPPKDTEDSRERCADTDKEPLTVKFYDEIYKHPIFQKQMEGIGPRSRYALVCNDIYFVINSHPSFGAEFFGPFNFSVQE